MFGFSIISFLKVLWISVLTDNGFLPKEHFSKKGSTAEDAKFDKTLTEDLS